MAYSKEDKYWYQKRYRLTPRGIEARKLELLKDKSNRKKRWQEYKAFYRELRIEKGGKCTVCGYNKVVDILQFHHLRDKIENVCKYRGPMSAGVERRIRAEAEKCVLVCPNCHWEITLKEIKENKYVKS